MLNKIFIVKTDNFYLNSLRLLDKLLDNENHVLFCIYNKPSSYDILYKIKQILKTQYKKKLSRCLFYTTYEDLSDDAYSIALKTSEIPEYKEYIYLPSNGWYTNKFIQEIVSHKESLDIKYFFPYQLISSNYKLINNESEYIKCIPKKILIEKNPTTNDKKYRSKNFFLSTNKFHNKHIVMDQDFMLLYLTETPDVEMSDSYCFFYEDNHKCMNIANKIAGSYNLIDENNIQINWENGYQNLYTRNETDNTYLCKKQNML